MLSRIFGPLHSVTNEATSAINPVTTENMDDSHLQMETHALRYCESTLWTVSKKKWDTKEGKGKSMMHALCTVLCQKACLWMK